MWDKVFDIDYCYERRGEVIEYVKGKYGHENVCNIIAKGCLTAKNVCRRVLSAYEFDQRTINIISKTIPDDVGITLEEAFHKSPEFKMYMMQNIEQYRQMLKLENGISHVSKHAAGIVISPVPISEHIPCMSDGEDRSMYMSQWDKKELEKVGFIKFDFLGLKTLTIIDKAVRAVLRLKGTVIDWNTIDLENDPRLYETLNGDHIKGVFQLSAPSAEQVLRRIHPTCFEDVVAANALCRPGVKERDLYIEHKHNPEMYEYDNDIIREILEPTYGAIVYQEQTMLLMNRLAGWSLGKADKMRKVKNLEDYREDFVTSCASNGVGNDVANKIFDRFDLGYSFNRSHAVSYAVISMQTAWLLTYHPAEFMAAVLTLELTAQEPEFKAMIKQCQALGVPVIPPDINLSTSEFYATERGILFPLNLVKNVGQAAVAEILRKRPYTSVEDLVKRTTKAKVNKRCVGNLIKAGCFDRLSQLNRSAQLKTFDKDCQDIYDKNVCRMYEVETLGFMLTEHPLMGTVAKKFSELSEDKEHTYHVVIDTAKKVMDRKGNPMAFITVETASEMVNCVVFSRVYERVQHLAKDGVSCHITGKRNGESFMINNMY